MVIDLKKYKKLTFFVLMILTFNAVGQTRFVLEPFIYGGREFNIFKSPDLLLDLGTNQYVDKDTLIVSDNFLDVGFDSKLQVRKSKKYKFELGSDLWLRNYFHYKEVNQKRLAAYALFEKNLSKKFLIGAEYEFSWNDKIGTTISGEELLRSFKYFSNRGEAYLELTPSKKFEAIFTGIYEKKKYYEDITETPLDHINVGGELSLEIDVNKKNAIQVDIFVNDRQYDQYFASDSLGDESPDYPMRHFQYLEIGIGYKFKPVKGFQISPYYDYSIRKDLFQEYYSYTGHSPGIKLKYSSKTFYAYVNAQYRQIKYEERYAYTYVFHADLLEYNYLKYDVILKYHLTKKLELYAKLSSDNRNSNTELEHSRTRRPYNNHELLFGINYALFNYKSK